MKRSCLITVQAMALLFAGLVASDSTLASTNTGIISSMAGANAPIVYLALVSAPNGYAACSLYHRYIIDISTPGGRGMLALALTARAMGKPVTMIGSGVCNTMPGDAEDIYNVIF